jgi:hypothetical protein
MTKYLVAVLFLIINACTPAEQAQARGALDKTCAARAVEKALTSDGGAQ